MNLYIYSVERTFLNEKSPHFVKLGFMKRTVKDAIKFIFVYIFYLTQWESIECSTFLPITFLSISLSFYSKKCRFSNCYFYKTAN